MAKTHDLVNMGRSSIDLYANDVGTPFVNVGSFAAYIGGSPTNICVGSRRLGLKTVMLTAIGDDPVGDFVLNFLDNEGVVTDYIPRKPEARTSAAVLGIEPPDKFPLTFYRDNAADVQITIDDVLAAPVTNCKVFQFAGTNLSKDPLRSATLFAAEQARAAGAKIVLDIDFRPDQWHDIRAFGIGIRGVLPLVDMVIGTQDEINAAMLTHTDQMSATQSSSNTEVAGDVAGAIETLMGYGPEILIEKRGATGARIHEANGVKIDVPGFPVEIYNVVGAGDAFASGLLYGYVQGWELYRAVRLGNACGAIVVTQHGCANFMPTLDEVDAFVADYGGLD
jgi:5-dehydro-2-deoxygluconokinase